LLNSEICIFYIPEYPVFYYLARLFKMNNRLARIVNMIRLKISAYFLILLFSLLCNGLKSQDINTTVISGVEDKISLEEYLSGLPDFKFFYQKDLLNDVFLYASDNGKTLNNYLDHAMTQRGIAYLVYKDKNIVFVERTRLNFNDQEKYADTDGSGNLYAVVNVGDPMLAGKFKRASLKGYVRNGKTGESLPGAVIHFPELDLGVVTDLAGYYSVELPVGKQATTYSYIGFEEREVMVNMISPGTYNVELFESTVAIDQVVITSKSNANVVSTEMSIIRLDARSINNIPVLMGEPDLMKTMTLLPGVQSSGDMASGFNVRGGNTDQNLILLDDVPIYNSNHLFGMFSIIDTRTIENLELFKGGAPARYGGRASAFMDIDLKEGNLKEWEGYGNLGLFSSKMTLHGPIVKEKVSLIIGGRTTYSDWILKRLPDLELRKSRANFYDINAKLNIILNRKNRLSLFTYLSNDYFDLAGKNSYEYSNRLGSLKWSYIAGEKLTFSLSAFISDYKTFSVEKDNPANAFSIATGIQQLGVKYRLLYTLNEKHSFEGGVEGNYYTFFPGEQNAFGEESNKDPLALEEEHSAEVAGYIQDIYEITGQLSLSVGLRYSHYLCLGPATINLYEDGSYIDNTTLEGNQEFGEGDIIKTYPGLEPRMGIRYSLGTSSSLKLGVSRNYQYMHILSNSSVVIPTDTWKSSDKYIKPAVSDQVSLGFFRNFNKGILETSAEIYYKKINNILEYKNGAELLLNESIEQDVLSAKMNAYGIELLVRRNAGRLTGWVSYAYSRSFLKTSGAHRQQLINEGEKYPANYDKPHDLSVVASYKISRRFIFSSSFTYSTGRPATYPESFFPVNRNPIVVYSDRNKYRLRDYHRLDLSLTWDTSLKREKKYYSSWVLSIYNVYGHNNVYSTYYKKDIPTAKNNYKKYAFYELSIIGTPIPSITYNIRF